ncbi:MAG: hypothetical protein K2K95_11555, partial [Muribaculaceae bacterium]|nr:hypothetical protein [Muribaculaceae bacterium]
MENNLFYLKMTYLCSQLKKFHFTLKLKTNLITFIRAISASLADLHCKVSACFKEKCNPTVPQLYTGSIEYIVITDEY